jgi:ribosomal 50S subunit-associated protein YjgA (DUF615 family)
MKLSHTKNKKKFKTRNLTELSADLNELSANFLKKIGRFENLFCPIKKI